MIKNGDVLLDRYRIKSTLGSGGMAVVYLAFDLVTKKDVAIKMIREDTMRNKVNLDRFQREARAAASLNHQNVVRVINLGSYEGRPFMVTELIKGQTLKDVLNTRGKFTSLEACDIMYQLCSAVMHAHQHGVIHRDIKPENVFMLADGTIKLSDFGIATFQDETSRLTKTETVVGSVYYMAPEITQGGTANVASDIYSLGVTFFELVTGTLPFDGDTPIAVAYAHIKEKFPSPKKFNSKVPTLIEKIILKACAKKPGDRYSDVFEMRKDIDRILREPSLIKNQSFFSRIFSRS